MTVQRKIIAPLLLVTLIFIILVSGYDYYSRKHWLMGSLVSHTDPIAKSIGHYAEMTDSLDDLQQFVSRMATQKGIDLIVVAQGDDLNIVASTEHSWLGKTGKELPNPEHTLKDLERAYSTKQASIDLNHGKNFYVDYTIPIKIRVGSVTENELNDGVIMLHYDSVSYRNIFIKNVIGDLLFMLFMIALSGVILFMLLKKNILIPLSRISHVVQSRISGNMNIRAEVISNDEFGSLAKSYNQLLDTVDNNEEKLREQNVELADLNRELSWFKAAIDQGCIIAITDVKGNIIHANQTFSDISGYRIEELIGKNHRILNSGTHDKEFFTDMYTTIASGKVWRAEICNKRKDGSYYWVDTIIIPELSRQGKPVRYLSLRIDITERKNTAIKLEEAREDAEAANRAKTSFLAIMSHEIRTPMNAIIGMTSLVLDSDLDDEQREYVDIIRTSGDALLNLINDILDFSKIESDKIELENVRFSIADCVEEAIEISATPARTKALEVISFFETDLPAQYLGDAHRIQQILINLLSNAIKFTETGEVSVSVKNEGINENIHTLSISVKDTGIGIPEESIPHLFEPFKQVDGSINRKYGGTGLGLAICKRLASVMGGELTCKSVYGQGSTFIFRLALPVVDAHITVHKLTKVESLEGKKILVLDDNLGYCKYLEKILGTWKFQPFIYTSPEKALTELGDIQPDLMIVDFNMHSMNGIEFSKEAKRLLSKNVPILLLTAVNMENETYSSDDISCILYKPIKSQSLSAKILEYLQVKEKGQNKTSSDFDSLLASRNPLKILVVEDNPVNVRVICHLLKKFGYQADVSSDGMEAFDSVKRQHYDLVLMDVEMPVLDGIDATVKIRNELPDDKQPIIVALTANVEVDTKNRVIEAGMNGCITKPVQIQELSNLLNKTKPGYKLYGSDEILDSGLVEFVDRERVHEFEKLDASEDLIMETLLNGFGEHLSSMIGNLKLALVSKDKEAFLSDLYTLKSSSGDVGLTVLYNQLETIGHLFDDDNHWPSEEQIDALSITGQQTYNYLVENGWVRPDFKW